MNAVELVRKLFADADKANCLESVWKLVTALRGPDNEDIEWKLRYTTPIRKALINREMAYQIGVTADTEYGAEPFINEEAIIADYSGHFTGHVTMASQVLQLSMKG